MNTTEEQALEAYNSYVSAVIESLKQAILIDVLSTKREIKKRGLIKEWIYEEYFDGRIQKVFGFMGDVGILFEYQEKGPEQSEGFGYHALWNANREIALIGRGALTKEGILFEMVNQDLYEHISAFNMLPEDRPSYSNLMYGMVADIFNYICISYKYKIVPIPKNLH